MADARFSGPPGAVGPRGPAGPQGPVGPGGFGDIGAKVSYAGANIAAASVFAVIPWDTLIYDPTIISNPPGLTQIGGAHPSRFTPPSGEGGKYLIVIDLRINTGPGFNVGYKINGAGSVIAFGGGFGVICANCVEITLADTDYVEIFGLDGGGSGAIVAGTNGSIRRVG